MYKRIIKRGIDILLSLCAMVVLLLPMLVVGVIIKIDSPGPIFFRQKRIAIHKKTFTILKFRSMPVSVPHDTPTHEFRAGNKLSPWQKAMRKYSIDEIPQIFNIFCGQMSVIGPRPALWNQDDLIAERDKYGANDIKPGLTGWAQINGRDRLEIPEKAVLDGFYAEKLNCGGFAAFFMDCQCFFGTIGRVLHHDGVVEGGTGKMADTKESHEVVKK